MQVLVIAWVQPDQLLPFLVALLLCWIVGLHDGGEYKHTCCAIASTCFAATTMLSMQPMKVKDALEHFGSAYKIAQVLEIEQSTVSRWRKKRIPMHWAWKLHQLSEQKVPFDPTAYNK